MVNVTWFIETPRYNQIKPIFDNIRKGHKMHDSWWFGAHKNSRNVWHVIVTADQNWFDIEPSSLQKFIPFTICAQRQTDGRVNGSLAGKANELTMTTVIFITGISSQLRYQLRSTDSVAWFLPMDGAWPRKDIYSRISFLPHDAAGKIWNSKTLGCTISSQGWPFGKFYLIPQAI